jgi:hypothetical protein
LRPVVWLGVAIGVDFVLVDTLHRLEAPNAFVVTMAVAGLVMSALEIHLVSCTRGTRADVAGVWGRASLASLAGAGLMSLADAAIRWL